MTKAELTEKVAKDVGLTKTDAGKAIQSVLEGITKGLAKKNSKVTLVTSHIHSKTIQRGL